jgi:hypothetical protein
MDNARIIYRKIWYSTHYTGIPYAGAISSSPSVKNITLLEDLEISYLQY